MFDVCTTGDMAHIETIFELLPQTRQHQLKRLWQELEYVCRVIRGAHIENF